MQVWRPLGPRLAPVLVAALVLVACGSDGSTTTRGTAPGPTEEGGAVGARLPVPSFESADVAVAVTDLSHGLVLEAGAGGNVVGAGLVAADGSLSELPTGLPELHRPQAIGVEDGFVVTGYRCTGREGLNDHVYDDELLCADDSAPEVPGGAEPVVVRLDVDGAIEWTQVGPRANPTRIGLGTPRADGALMQVDGSMYAVSAEGFTVIDAPDDGGGDLFTPCALPSGDLIAATEQYRDGADDASGGERRLYHQVDDGWRLVGDPMEVPAGGLLTTICVPGGLVADQGVMVSPDAVRTVDRSILLHGSGEVTGIAASGTVLHDAVPPSLVDVEDGRAVTSFDGFERAAMAWDGRAVILLGAPGLMIVEV